MKYADNVAPGFRAGGVRRRPDIDGLNIPMQIKAMAVANTRRAAVYVCGVSESADDARQLMDMLGLTDSLVKAIVSNE